MFPGRTGDGIDIVFKPGLTLILGANGLGKTTLVTLLYRMLTGPFDMRAGGEVSDLGSRNIEAVPLNSRARRIFAARVPDGAADSTATLALSLGKAQIEVTRSLSNLGLQRLVLDDAEQSPDEDDFQEIILSAASVTSFGDWLLLLRHLTFYFEDRRALVWDQTAQRQLLRMLFLTNEVSDEWKSRERYILSLDSRMRNLRAALSREQAAAVETEARILSSGEVRGQIEILQEYQRVDRPKAEVLDAQLLVANEEVQDAQLAKLTSEMETEHAYRDLERLQLLAIDAAFPNSDESARYLYAKLFSGDRCLACGSSAPTAVAELQQRLDDNRCLICGSSLTSPAVEAISGPALDRARARLEASEIAATTASDRLRLASNRRSDLVATFQTLSADIAKRDAEIRDLVDRLPPEDAALIEQHAELTSLGARVTAQTEELAVLRADFTEFIDTANRRIARSRRKVAETFQGFAGDFLLEDCKLIWSIQRDRLGESGDPIEFPGFELDLSSANRPDMTRRDRPEQVSESQREFIDLAFRMTLMATAGRGSVGSLVIDAPESSLDAVFVNRAAEVLSRFAVSEAGNRLVITSNLIEGDLIPALMRQAGIRTVRDGRVVDLLSLAAPTAAVSARREEYEDVRRRLYRRARAPR